MDEIMIGMNEDGSWGIREEPYATIECKTEEDYEKLVKLLENQVAKKPKNILIVKKCGATGNCSMCGEKIVHEMNYCINCGQKLDWSELYE